MDEVLKKCLHIWESPLNGNAVVILQRDKRPGRVLVGDLDMGEQYTVRLEELEVKLRTAEEADFGFSWTCDAESDIVNAVMDAEGNS